jgi:hypothetical protein
LLLVDALAVGRAGRATTCGGLQLGRNWLTQSLRVTKLAAWWGPKISARRVPRHGLSGYWGSGFGLLPSGPMEEEPIIIATVAALDGFDKTIGASHESGRFSKHIVSQPFQIKADIEGQRLRRI